MINTNEFIKDGASLEFFVASYFQASGFYIESNLKWIEDKEGSSGKVDILELDVLAKLFDENSVQTTLIECKRGCTFNELFMFSGIAKLIAADKNLLVCQSHDFEELKKLGDKSDIQVKSPEELISTLSSDSPLNERVQLFYLSNELCNKFISKNVIRNFLSNPGVFSKVEKKAYSSIRSALAILIGQIWREPNLVTKAQALKSFIDSNSDFVRSVARQLKIKPGNKNSEYYMNQNVLCQAAAFLVLKTFESYLMCAINCAVLLENGHAFPLEQIKDKSFISVVNSARENLAVSSKAPLFLQGLICIFGGVLSLIGEDKKHIGDYLGIDVSEVDKIIVLLKNLFRLTDSLIPWAFIEDMGVLSLKYIPAPLKGMGMVNREKLGFSVDDFCFSKQWKGSFEKYEVKED